MNMYAKLVAKFNSPNGEIVLKFKAINPDLNNGSFQFMKRNKGDIINDLTTKNCSGKVYLICNHCDFNISSKNKSFVKYDGNGFSIYMPDKELLEYIARNARDESKVKLKFCKNILFRQYKLKITVHKQSSIYS